MSTIPVTLVTGFLGAGKTSVINHLLRDRAFEGTAVLINEFGDVAIDHDLVAEFSPELIVTTTGCLCCSASSEIKQSLFELWDRRQKGEIRRFSRVIVETTGLADPVPVIQSLLGEPTPALVDRVVCSQFALAHVLAMFDSIHGARTLDEHPEAVKQLALADAVLATKTDLPGVSELPRERLNQINPGAVILDRQQQWPQIRDLILAPRTYDLRSKGEDAIAWLNGEAAQADHRHDHDHNQPHDHAHGHRHDAEIRAHCIVLDEPVSPFLFDLFLYAIRTTAGSDLLRVKGLIALQDDPERPVVLHGVQHLVHTIDRLDHWPSADRRTRIVLIGREVNVEALRSVLTNPSQQGLGGAFFGRTAQAPASERS